MCCDGVAAALLDVADHALEPLVGEDLDLPAVVADDVMVVLLGASDGLVARDPVAEIESLDEPRFRQHLEHAVDARQPDALALRVQLAVDVLCADAAALALEELDHAQARKAAPVTGGLQLGERLF